MRPRTVDSPTRSLRAARRGQFWACASLLLSEFGLLGVVQLGLPHLYQPLFGLSALKLGQSRFCDKLPRARALGGPDSADVFRNVGGRLKNWTSCSDYIIWGAGGSSNVGGTRFRLRVPYRLWEAQGSDFEVRSFFCRARCAAASRSEVHFENITRKFCCRAVAPRGSSGLRGRLWSRHTYTYLWLSSCSSSPFSSSCSCSFSTLLYSGAWPRGGRRARRFEIMLDSGALRFWSWKVAKEWSGCRRYAGMKDWSGLIGGFGWNGGAVGDQVNGWFAVD